jgi:CDP-diacylglycerol--glycerol-3-phosphate 3-phosphatidyltransferase
MRSEIALLLAVLGVGLLSMPLYAMGAARGAKDPHEVEDRGSFILGPFVRNWFLWFQKPVDRAALALGLGPLFFNLLGVFFGILAAVFFGTGHLSLAGWCVLLGGWADIVDGRLARALGVASERGAFLDSTLDRFAEFAAFVGMAVLFKHSDLALVLVVTALGGSLLVSYARARGESVGVVCKVGVMQRAERLLLLGFGSLLDPAVSAWLGRDIGTLLVPVLWIVALGTVGTAVYRTAWIAARLPHVEV